MYNPERRAHINSIIQKASEWAVTAAASEGLLARSYDSISQAFSQLAIAEMQYNDGRDDK